MGFGDFVMGGLDKLPFVGGFLESPEEKRLKQRQQQMAEEMRRRAEMMQRRGPQALQQELMAFGPRNRMMAQVLGPEAAFSPQEMARLAGDPGAMTRQDYERMVAEAQPGAIGSKTTTGGKLPFTQQDVERMRENERRMAEVEAAFAAQPMSGPQPLQSRQAARARRF